MKKRVRKPGIGYQAMKRTFDIAASAAGLVLTSPIFAASVIGIELSDPGPVFYLADSPWASLMEQIRSRFLLESRQSEQKTHVCSLRIRINP